ncbi:MAG TPA: phosphatase PAP2 family protein [Crocinitomix sp.]|nr:phosphatase PAP2 family protein [Crocinitomix sp.]
MTEKLEQLDKAILLLINGNHSPFFDELMWQISHQLIWLPFYIFILIYALKKLNRQKIVFFMVGVGFCFLLADRISVIAFKDIFMRYRPTHHLELKYLMHTYTFPDGSSYLGGLYGFVSSHSANFFAFSTYLFLWFKSFNNKWLFIFIWACLIGYSRIYLGVHYPSDVFVGGLLGILIGFIIYKMITFTLKKLNNELA